jgi:hypothetical protein
VGKIERIVAFNAAAGLGVAAALVSSSEPIALAAQR